MILGLTIVTSLAYMFSGVLGFTVFLCTVAVVARAKNRNSMEKLFVLMLLTLPIYMTPVLPSLHSIYSWNTLVILIFIVQLIRKGNHPSGKSITLFAVLLIVAFFSLTGEKITLYHFYYTAQFLLSLILVLLAFSRREWIQNKIAKDGAMRLVNDLGSVVTGFALTILIQFFSLTIMDIRMGNVSFFSDRISFDANFFVYSGASSILGIGILLSLFQLSKGAYLRGAALALSCFIAIPMNSSRSGLLIAFVVGILYLAGSRRSLNLGTGVKVSILMTAGALVAALAFIFPNSRVFNQAFFLNDNGRIDLMVAAVNGIFSGVGPFLLGSGITRETQLAHNFVLETIYVFGALFTFLVAFFLAPVIRYLFQSELGFVALGVVLASFLFSGFHAFRPAMVIIVILVSLPRELDWKAPTIQMRSTWDVTRRTKADPASDGGFPSAISQISQREHWLRKRL